MIQLRSFALVAGLVLSASVLAACSASSQSTTVAVTLRDYIIEPGQLSAPANAAITITVKNAGPSAHSFSVNAAGHTLQTSMLYPGGTASLSVPPLAAGTYETWCAVPGHREAGMSGVLVVGNGQVSGSQQAAGGGAMAGIGAGMSRMSASQMAAAHKRSTQAFPATTKGIGNQLLLPTVVNGVKVYQLETKQIRLEVSPGVFKDAFAYNGQIPGPQIRVRQGDQIRVVLTNSLPQPTTIHFHGMTVPNAMDGVPYITQDPVLPGGRFTYEFTVVDQPGTYMYHSHMNSAEQVGLGLFGSLVVEPATPSWDVEYTEFLSDGLLGYTINGKSFPATAPLTAKPGQRVLVRMLNTGELLHTMHLHGYHFTVVARDGAAASSPYDIDTLDIAPGETFDAAFTASNSGVWAFHCHVLGHAEDANGMFGMVTALIVKA